MSERFTWVDFTPVLLLTAVGIAVTTSPDGAEGTLVDTLLVPVVTLPVLWWRRAPLAAALAIALGMIVSGIPSFDQIRCGFALPGALLILFSLGTREEPHRSIAGLTAIEAGIVFLLFTDPVLDPAAAFLVVLAGMVWGAGRLFGSRGRAASELEARTADLERTREETAQVAADVERMRVAADLDVATRERVRAVVELAREAESGGDGAEGGSREAFGQIERDGRESLNQMRELLGVLRSDERDAAPRPTLAQLEDLIEEARAGGRPVALSVDGSRRPLPTGIELAAYRVIQHALAALGVAGRNPATIRLSYRESELVVELVGEVAPGAAAQAALGSARERVAAHGGSASSVRADGGRVRLRFMLPVAAADA